MKEINIFGGGIGFVGVLTILFIALKLLNKISWSWWWVLSPIWINVGIQILIIFIIIMIAINGGIFKI